MTTAERGMPRGRWRGRTGVGSAAIALLVAGAPLTGSACAGQAADGQALEALREGRYAEAIRGLQARVRGDPSPEARRLLAEALAEVGRYEEAEAALRDAAGGAPPELLTSLGQVLLLQGKRDEAARRFEAAIEVGAGDRLTAEIELAELMLRSGRRDAAFERFDRFIDAYNSGGALSARDLVAVGRAVQHLGNDDPVLFRDALRAFDEAIAADPEDPEPRIRVGELFLEKYSSGDARASFQDVLRRNPSHPSALLGMAKVSEFDGAPGALEQALGALQVNSRLVPARVFLARLKLGLEEYAEAAEEAERALAVNPTSLEALAVLAAARQLQGDSEGFERARRRAFELDPGYADFYLVQAELAVQQRQYARAVDAAQRAVELDPRSWKALGLLGINQLRVGQIEDGHENLDRAFAGDPYNVWFKNTLDLLDTFERYEVTETPRFRIVIEDRESALLAPYVASAAEEAYAALEARYRYRPPTPIRLELFSSHADFSVRTVGLAGLGALGVSFGSVLAMDSPSAREPGEFNWASTLWHEVAHAFHLGMSAHRVPRWFTEGLAVYEQRRARPGWGNDLSFAFLLAYKEGRLLPVSELNEGFVRPAYPQQVAFSYFQASLVCEMIEERFGFEALRRMLEGYGEGRSSEELFRQVLGMDPHELDRAFDAHFRSRYRGPLAAVKAPPTGPESRRPPSRDELASRIRDDPDDFRAQLALGQAFLQEGRPDDAVPHLERAKALFPQYGAPDSPYWLLAGVHVERGRLERAAEELAFLAERNETNYAAGLEQARVLEEIGDRAGAAAALERVLEIHPFQIPVHLRLAELYESLDEPGKAVRTRRAVLALDPQDRAGAHYHLARALLRAGDAATARSEVLRALEIAPGFREAQDLLLEMRSGGRDPSPGPSNSAGRGAGAAPHPMEPGS